MDPQSSHEVIANQFNKVLDRLESNCRDHTQVAAITRSARDLCNVGEEGIAFENMVENLYEFDVPLTRELYHEIDVLRQLLCLSQESCRHLAVLVVG